MLLSDSGMRKHPLTPMTDAKLVRALQAQMQRVGLVDHCTVAAGEAAIRARIAELQADGVGMAIVDDVSHEAPLPILLACIFVESEVRHGTA